MLWFVRERQGRDHTDLSSCHHTRVTNSFRSGNNCAYHLEPRGWLSNLACVVHKFLSHLWRRISLPNFYPTSNIRSELSLRLNAAHHRKSIGYLTKSKVVMGHSYALIESRWRLAAQTYCRQMRRLDLALLRRLSEIGHRLSFELRHQTTAILVYFSILFCYRRHDPASPYNHYPN